MKKMKKKVEKPNVENQKERVFQKKDAQKNKIDIMFTSLWYSTKL